MIANCYEAIHCNDGVGILVQRARVNRRESRLVLLGISMHAYFRFCSLKGLPTI